MYLQNLNEKSSILWNLDYGFTDGQFKDIHFSGISEASFIQLNESYLTQEITKSEVIEMLGTPLVTENSENLWIYRTEKEQGNATFKKIIYNKTLKLYFENNILRSVEEINLN